MEATDTTENFMFTVIVFLLFFFGTAGVILGLGVFCLPILWWIAETLLED